MTRTNKPIGKPDYYDSDPRGFHVYSWCPTPKPTVPPTQVHFHLETDLGVKGPATLDRLIDALLEHREDVWGKRARD